MDIFLTASLLCVLLLALDLLTAPKYPDAAPGTGMKQPGRPT